MSSTSSPEPEIVRKKTKKPQKKSKVQDKHGKNEGENPESSYKPPEGYVLMKHASEEGDFDWDALKDDDNLELWVVRVPEGLKPKYLESIKLEAPSSSKTARLGSIDRKNATYDVWSLGEDECEVVGGDEMRSLSCLLPRHSEDGKLYQAPKPVARRLVISARPALPTPPHSSPNSSPIVHQNPPRPRYPKEMLKHRFMPLGSRAPIDDDPTRMDEDEDVTAPAAEPVGAKKAARAHKTAEGAEGGKKRRKGDAETPKKTKKVKTAS